VNLTGKIWQKVIWQIHFNLKLYWATFDQTNLAISLFDKVGCYDQRYRENFLKKFRNNYQCVRSSVGRDTQNQLVPGSSLLNVELDGGILVVLKVKNVYPSSFKG